MHFVIYTRCFLYPLLGKEDCLDTFLLKHKKGMVIQTYLPKEWVISRQVIRR